MAEVKVWRCENGHGLGVVQRTKSGGHWLTRLALFRQAIDSQDEHLVEVDVIATVEGTTLDVRCSVCGATRSWFMGEAAIAKLLEKVSGR